MIKRETGNERGEVNDETWSPLWQCPSPSLHVRQYFEGCLSDRSLFE